LLEALAFVSGFVIFLVVNCTPLVGAFLRFAKGVF
jgi:hypothetical protein